MSASEFNSSMSSSALNYDTGSSGPIPTRYSHTSESPFGLPNWTSPERLSQRLPPRPLSSHGAHSVDIALRRARESRKSSPMWRSREPPNKTAADTEINNACDDCQVNLEFPHATRRLGESKDGDDEDGMPPADLKGLLRFMQSSGRDDRAVTTSVAHDYGESPKLSFLGESGLRDLEASSAASGVGRNLRSREGALRDLRTDTTRVLEPVMNTTASNAEPRRESALQQELERSAKSFTLLNADADGKPIGQFDIGTLVGPTPGLDRLSSRPRAVGTYNVGAAYPSVNVGLNSSRPTAKLKPAIEELEDTSNLTNMSELESRPKFYEEEAAFFREKLAYFSEPAFTSRSEQIRAQIRAGSGLGTVAVSAELPAWTDYTDVGRSGELQREEPDLRHGALRRGRTVLGSKPARDSLAFRGAPVIPTLHPATPPPMRGLRPFPRKQAQFESVRVAVDDDGEDDRVELLKMTERSHGEEDDCTEESTRAPMDATALEEAPVGDDDDAINNSNSKDALCAPRQLEISAEETLIDEPLVVVSDENAGVEDLLRYLKWLNHTCAQLSVAAARAVVEAKTYVNSSNDVIEAAELQELAFAKVVQLAEAALELPPVQAPHDLDNKDLFQSIRDQRVEWPTPSSVRATPPPLLLPPPGPPVFTSKSDTCDVRETEEACVSLHRAVASLAAACLRCALETAVQAGTLASAHKNELQSVAQALKLQNAASLRDVREEMAGQVAKLVDEGKRVEREINLRHQGELRELTSQLESTKERRAVLEHQLQELQNKVQELDERRETDIVSLTKSLKIEHEGRNAQLRNELSKQYDERLDRREDEVRQSFNKHIEDLEKQNEKREADLDAAREELGLAQAQVEQLRTEKADMERTLIEQFKAELKKARQESSVALAEIGEKAANAAALNSRQVQRVTREAEQKYEARVQELHRTIDDMRAELQLQKLDADKKVRDAKQLGVVEGERLTQRKVAQQRLVYEKKVSSLETVLSKLRARLHDTKLLQAKMPLGGANVTTSLQLDTGSQSRNGLEDLRASAVTSDLVSSEEEWDLLDDRPTLDDDISVAAASSGIREPNGRKGRRKRDAGQPASLSEDAQDKFRMLETPGGKIATSSTDPNANPSADVDEAKTSSAETKAMGELHILSTDDSQEDMLPKAPKAPRMSTADASSKGLPTLEATKAAERRIDREVLLNPGGDPTLAPNRSRAEKGTGNRSSEDDLKYTTLLDHYIAENPLEPTR